MLYEVITHNNYFRWFKHSEDLFILKTQCKRNTVKSKQVADFIFEEPFIMIGNILRIIGEKEKYRIT